MFAMAVSRKPYPWEKEKIPTTQNSDFRITQERVSENHQGVPYPCPRCRGLSVWLPAGAANKPTSWLCLDCCPPPTLSLCARLGTLDPRCGEWFVGDALSDAASEAWRVLVAKDGHQVIVRRGREDTPDWDDLCPFEGLDFFELACRPRAGPPAPVSTPPVGIIRRGRQTSPEQSSIAFC